MGRLASTSGGRLKSKSTDLGSVEGLVDYAKSVGLGTEATAIANPIPKLSFLQRLGKGLGALNPAEAILTSKEKGLRAGLIEYPKRIVQGLGGAITGTDYGGTQRGFKEVAEEVGIDNKIAKWGIGFLGDVLLDPSTYFGGAIAKGLGVGVKAGAKIGIKGIAKVAPEAATGLEMVGTGLKDALGRAFKYGYGATKGAPEDVMTFLSKKQKARLGLASSNLSRLGTGTLTKSQSEELALKLVEGKRGEFLAREAGQTGGVIAKDLEPLAQEARKYKTAEEFVKAQQPLYHGTTNEAAVSIEKNGFAKPSVTTPESGTAKLGDNVFFTKNKEYGNRFADVSSNAGGKTLEVFAPDIKLAKIEDAKGANLIEKIADLKAKGYDGSITGKGRGEEIAVWNLGKIKTKSQLTDFYNKAQSKTISPVISTDPLVQKTIEAQKARTAKFAGQLGLENPYETYFPFIKKDKLDVFLKQVGMKQIRVGSEAYRKEFKNLLTNDAIELNPAKAFFTSEAQQVTDRMSRDFLRGFVQKYGKPLLSFKNIDEARAVGYDIVREKGMFGKELGYVGKYDAKLIKDSLDPGFHTINMLAKATGFDAVTALFKRSVTGLFAPFHIRNYMSGHIQNFETLGVDALSPKNIAVGQKIAYLMGKDTKFPSGTLTLGGKTTKFADVMKPFVERFSGDTFYNSDFDYALQSGGELKTVAKLFSVERLKTTAKTLGLGQEAIPFKVGRAIGQFIEHSQKATAYVTALGQGKTIPEALDLATKAGFDYRALTSFESQIMRRIIPFYSFARKNIGLQLRTLGENPQRINQVLAFFGNMGDQLSEEEKQALPKFLQEAIGIKLQDTPEGLKQYISSFGTPIEAFAQLFGSNPILRAISMTNPIIKTPTEIGIGKDSFRQRDLKEVYDANEYKLAPQFVKDLLGITPVEKDILQKGGDGKLRKVGTRTQYVADPVRLLIARSLFTSRGVSYLDQAFGGDMTGLIKALKLTTGLKPVQQNLEVSKSIQETGKRRALEDLLTQKGGLNKFQTVYKK